MHKFINYKFDAFAMISERRANDDDNIICLPFNLYTLKNKKKSDRNVFDNSFSLSAYSARRRDKRTVNSKKATENCMTS